MTDSPVRRVFQYYDQPELVHLYVTFGLPVGSIITASDDILKKIISDYLEDAKFELLNDLKDWIEKRKTKR